MNFHEIIFISLSLLQKNFDMAKSIRGILENLFEYYFVNIFVNVSFFSDLKLNITVSSTLKYCCKKALYKKLKLMGGAMKYFPKILMGHEIFRSMVSWATNFFLKHF